MFPHFAVALEVHQGFRVPVRVRALALYRTCSFFCFFISPWSRFCFLVLAHRSLVGGVIATERLHSVIRLTIAEVSNFCSGYDASSLSAFLSRRVEKDDGRHQPDAQLLGGCLVQEIIPPQHVHTLYTARMQRRPSDPCVLHKP